MNMKSMLLGTAAGLMVASGAYAADLPGDAAPAAVDYVKVCDAYGAGFFYIPGTETCLKLSGRVRARVTYAAGDTTVDTLSFRTDGRVQFDARTASDIGTVRSFFELASDDNNKIELGDAFIQVGYVTVGKFGNVADGDVFFGDTGREWALGDVGGPSAQVLVDSLGGGFYVGASVTATGALSSKNKTIWSDGNGSDVNVAAAVGIAGQSWGKFDLSAVYQTFGKSYTGTFAPADSTAWGVKATADLKLIDKLDARLVASYADTDWNSTTYLTAALKYQATDALDVYVGGGVDVLSDGFKDIVIAQIGADYALAPGLIVTAEGNYQDQGSNSDWSAFVGLTRNW